MASDSELKGTSMAAARRARLLRLFIMVTVVIISAVLVIGANRRAAYAEAEAEVLRARARDLEGNGGVRRVNETTSSEKVNSWVQRGKGTGVAILTAFTGNTYNVMGELSSDTKAKYAAWYGYAFFLDNDLVQERMSFSEKSASRIALFRRHWNDYDWLLWTDADVLITNPKISFEEVLAKYAPDDSNVHVIMSKDWGGRQVNPGVSFIRTTDQGKAFVDRWAKEIEENPMHDDLLAIRDGMEKKRAPELQYVKFVKQSVLNSYPEMILPHLAYNATTVEHDPSHDLWKQGDLFVHVVNCLRQSYRIDSPCCDGIAARYWREFHLVLNSMIEEKRKSLGIEYIPKGPTFDDWTVPYGGNLGLL